MHVPRITRWVIGIWVLVAGTYALVSLLLKPGPTLTAFDDIVLCLAPLLANAGLLLNAGSPNWRRNLFWMLLALGCTVWMAGQFVWTYYELYLLKSIPTGSPSDIIFFLHGIPTMAAIALLPHKDQQARKLTNGYVDFALLLLWWVYLFLFTVSPWNLAVSQPAVYNHTYNILANIQNMVIVGGFGVLWLRTKGPWRVVYAHLVGAASTYMLISLTGVDQDKYSTGSLYGVPILVSFLWYGTAGVNAYRLKLHEQATQQAPAGNEAAADQPAPGEGVWLPRLAMATIMSLPLLALWDFWFSAEIQPVRDFRLLVTVLAAIPLGSLIFLRQQLLDKERLRLLEESRQSIQDLKQLQTQMVQSEKLVSLGQLAAGAAHEINNPLTAILGYADLLTEDASAGESAKSLACKIRDQARRTKQLVTSLLSFARQVPAERTLLDINAVVTNALQLHALNLRSDHIRVETQLEPVLPGVRGDANQLLQVFFNVISNATDSMEESGGVLTVKTKRERAQVVILFSDMGPGVMEPHRVFDPFYTTKPVGKGTGLGLSICYGLIREHEGLICCYNRPEGGATFRIELPAVLTLFPQRETPAPVRPKVPQG
jgi:signal transduction histidine kinase